MVFNPDNPQEHEKIWKKKPVPICEHPRITEELIPQGGWDLLIIYCVDCSQELTRKAIYEPY
jgi:hypothetical protein